MRLRAVIKADAYGHGAVRVGAHLAASGIERFAVALVEEGIELRQAGMSADILVMGPCQAEQRESIAGHGLVPTVSSTSQLRSWLDWDGGHRKQRVHLKVNTGMNRLGLKPGELAEALRAVRDSDTLELAGLMSHVASADDLASPRPGRQFALFEQLVDLLDDDERQRIEIHIANSAGLLHADQGVANVARPALALLGYDPARRLELEPVMSVVARVSQVQDLATGDEVGYGGRWRAGRATRLGVVPVGYADGYPWRLSGLAEAVVEGERVPVVGAVSMDMLTIDLTESAAREGSEVVLLGRQSQQTVDAFELADRAGSLIYEVLCGFGLRLKKIYRASEAIT